MKARLIAYFIFLPLILLAAFTNAQKYFGYLAIASIPISIALIIYMLIKTKAFYKSKKVLIFFLFGCGLALCPLKVLASDYGYNSPYPYGSFTGNPNADYAMDQYQRYLIYEASLLTERNEALKIIQQLDGRDDLTEDEQKKLEEAKKKYRSINKQLGITPCPTSQELHNEIVSDCWSCDIANLFIEAGDKIATGFYAADKKHGFTKSLLALGFFFWILTQVMKLLMSFGRGDIGAFFTAFFNKLLLVGGLFILLSFPIKNVVDFAISPFFLLSATITEHIGTLARPITDSIQGDKIDVLMTSASNSQRTVQCKYCDALKNGDQSPPDKRISEAMKYTISPEDRVVSPTMRNALLCTICSIYKITVPPTVTGQYIYCLSKGKTEDGSKIGKEKIYSDWDGWMVGVSLIISFFLMSAMFSFFLIDTFFRICFVLIILPFLIVAGAFESTRTYTWKGFEVLIHAVATYIIVALFMTLTIQIFYVMLGGDAGELVNLTYANNYDGLRKLIGFGENGGRIMLSCGAITLIIFLMLGQLDGYISELTGIKLENSGGAAAAMSVAGTAKAMGKAVSDTFSAEWKKPGNNSGNSPEDKAAKIRQWGEDTSDGAAEEATDNAADAAEKGIDNSGKWAADNLDKVGDGAMKGAKAAFKIPYIGPVAGVIAVTLAGLVKGATSLTSLAIRLGTKAVAKTVGGTIKYGSRALIKTVKRLNPAKILARNKYFNKTVGLFWQMGSNVKQSYLRHTQKAERKKKAKEKYR